MKLGPLFWSVYLSGEIHTPWRNEIADGIERAGLPVRFGPKYLQWNAAFDARFAAAFGKPLVTLHDAELDHTLKEIDAAAYATARDPDQVVKILHYVIEQV